MSWMVAGSPVSLAAAATSAVYESASFAFVYNDRRKRKRFHVRNRLMIVRRMRRDDALLGDGWGHSRAFVAQE